MSGPPKARGMNGRLAEYTANMHHKLTDKLKFQGSGACLTKEGLTSALLNQFVSADMKVYF